MTRKSQYGNVAITTTDTASTPIEIHESTRGAVYIPADFTGSQIGFAAAASRGGTYSDLLSAAGTLVSTTVSTSCWIVLPSGVFSMPVIKVVAASTQVTEVTLTVHHGS